MRVGAMAVAGVMLMSAPAAGPMPPNTVLLSQMMQTLSAQPGFTEAFLAEVEGGGHKAGAARLTPDLVHALREILLGKQWEKLDRFPGWTMGEINPTVRVVGHYAGKDTRVDDMATAGGAPVAAGSDAARKMIAAYLDLGQYTLSDRGPATLDAPATGEGFVESEYVKPLGAGVVRGDGPNPELAPMHAESARLADVLNRLSLNGLDAPANGQATVQPFAAAFQGKAVQSPEELIATLQATGHTVTVTDSRFFANFGHLHWNGQDVLMPFWVNTLTEVPHLRRPLLVPVAHAEYEWEVRGPKVNAAVSFYFGIDGKAEFRTMDQLDQAWVMRRNAHTYTAADAIEVTRLAGAIVRAYTHLHEAHPAIPFGGYYGFGVCQDVVAAIEQKMTGKTTLFPNTAEDSFFTDPRDAEVNALIRALPKDRGGKPPELERVFGSLPAGSTDAELRTLTVPGLADDLIAVHAAWQSGTVEELGARRRLRNVLYGAGTLLAVGLVWALIARRRRDHE